MTTLIPAPGAFKSTAKYDDRRDIYQTEAVLPTQKLAPGATASATTQLFAGAKEWATIRDYETSGVEGFIDSIDWGWFFFLTKPIFAVLHYLNAMIGNMGWAIIGLTFLIKLILFPLAYKSNVSMAKMKALQPQMEKIKEKRRRRQAEAPARHDGDVQEGKGQSGLWLFADPVQIPIFFSLYKVIFVTLELRHAPWIGWIKDLSAPDPSSILNLFGLLSFDTTRGRFDPCNLLAWYLADPFGYFHVDAAKAEPSAHRSNASDDLRLDALGLHVHARHFRERTCGLLDCQQHDHLHAAVFDYAQPRGETRCVWQHQGRL